MRKTGKSQKHGTTSDTPKSQSQADGTAADAPRGETQTKSDTSAKGTSLSDTFGEAGDPYGRGTLEVPETVVETTENAGDVKQKKDEAA
jgi:hypothetical protein